MNNKILLSHLRCIQDWPVKGVNFRDVTTLFKSPEALNEITNEMYELYKDKGITKIVGIESRGKLPWETVKEEYRKEYGTDIIEIHKDAINKNDVILLHDDLLATGGTMNAACHLVKRFCPRKIFCNFIIELCSEFPHSRNKFDKDIEITSLLSF